jgi:ADP-heptose:LPS heptosyltransferase
MKKILVVRRDNIGDLVCTLPLLKAIRQQRPDWGLYAYVNRYNAPILEHYQYADAQGIDQFWSYQKLKHRQAGESRLGALWQRWQAGRAMRAEGFDTILLAGGVNNSTIKWAEWLRPRALIRQDQLEEYAGSHEVERVCSVLPALGLTYQTPTAPIQPAPQACLSVKTPTLDPNRHWVAIHLSARKVSQRWPVASFVELIQQLTSQVFIAPQTPAKKIGVLLFWAPGSEKDPLHPGDDEKMQRVFQTCDPEQVIPIPTHTLGELISGLSQAHSVICADGGAMHVAAALGKPIVALFGDSDPARWHPWGVHHHVLQSNDKQVNSINTSTVLQAWQNLLQTTATM